MRILFSLIAMLLSMGVIAADTRTGQTPAAQGQNGGQHPNKGLPAPDLPAQVQSGRSLESTIIIRETDKGKVKEYRINGRAYMVRITPQVGPPYYLIDRDGDGAFETQTNDPRDQPVPMWILFSW